MIKLDSTPTVFNRSEKDNFVSYFDSEIIRVRRSTKYSILLVKMLGKTDLVSKNVSKSEKTVKFMRCDEYLTDLLTRAILRKFPVGIKPTCTC